MTPFVSFAGVDVSSTLLIMRDAVNGDNPPASSEAVAGYVDGIGQGSWARLLQRFPALARLGRVVSIAVYTTSVARIIDVEAGNPTTPDEAAAWVVKMIAHGIYRPGVYAPLSLMPEVKAALARTGLRRDQYVLWLADWVGETAGIAYLRLGYDAVQFQDAGSVDVSVCLPEFFAPGKPPVKPPAQRRPEGVASASISMDVASGRWEVTPEPGKVTWADKSRKASLLVHLDVSDGRWDIKPLPWDTDVSTGTA